jgi:hypothetical protein
VLLFVLVIADDVLLHVENGSMRLTIHDQGDMP